MSLTIAWRLDLYVFCDCVGCMSFDFTAFCLVVFLTQSMDSDFFDHVVGQGSSSVVVGFCGGVPLTRCHVHSFFNAFSCKNFNRG